MSVTARLLLHFARSPIRNKLHDNLRAAPHYTLWGTSDGKSSRKALKSCLVLRVSRFAYLERRELPLKEGRKLPFMPYRCMLIMPRKHQRLIRQHKEASHDVTQEIGFAASLHITAADGFKEQRVTAE